MKKKTSTWNIVEEWMTVDNTNEYGIKDLHYIRNKVFEGTEVQATREAQKLEETLMKGKDRHFLKDGDKFCDVVATDMEWWEDRKKNYPTICEDKVSTTETIDSLVSSGVLTKEMLEEYLAKSRG